MRRSTVLQRVEQEAELQLGLFWSDVERAEDLALHLGAVDTDGPPTKLPAIEHHVVGLGDALAGVGVHQVLVPVLGRSERVVGCVPSLCSVVVLEHREIDDPQRCPHVIEQAVAATEIAVADLHAQRADGVVDDLRLVRPEEQQVARLGAGALEDLRDGMVVKVLDDRTLQPLAALARIVDLDPGQTLCAIDLHELCVGVDVAAAQAAVCIAAVRHTERHHPAAGRRGRSAEDLEVDVGHHIGQFGELELHPQVGLI